MQCDHILLASEIIFGALGLVVEVASVLDGDLIPFLGLVGAVALGDNLPSDTHCACGTDRCCWIGFGMEEWGWIEGVQVDESW